MRPAVALALVVWPGAALAHHPVSEFGVALVEPTTIAEVTLEVGEFRQDSYRGRYQTLAAYVEYSLIDELAVSARLPVLRIDMAGEPVSIGIGDPEVALKGRLYATKHAELIVSAGLGLELPLGSNARGMSSGHWELQPFVVLSSSPIESLVFVLMVDGRFALDGATDANADTSGAGLTPAHVNFVPRRPVKSMDSDTEPLTEGQVTALRADHEIGTRLSIAYLFAPAYVLVGAKLDVPLGGDLSVASFGRLEVGVRITDHLRLAARAELPISGGRFERRGGVGVAWVF